MDPLLHELLGINGNEYPTTNKTDDEIKRLTLEEDMSEVKRATHILYRGQSIQKPSVYFNLYKILLEPDSFTKVLPLVSEGILLQSEDIQIDAGHNFIKLMKNHELTEENLFEILRINMNVATLWNQLVLDEWVLVFHEIIQRLPYPTISSLCESSIIKLSNPSQHPLSKYMAARLIGFIADENIKPTEPLFDKARFLCQDPDVEVRRIIAKEVMVKICRSVGTSLTENKYLEKILELTYDSDSQVKLAAIESLVEVLDMLSSGFKKTKMVPTLLELMNSVNNDVVKKMSFLIGKVVHKLEDILINNSQLLDKIEAILKEWASRKDFEIRRNIVYNIPYLIRAMPNKDALKEIYLKAAKDNSFEIRLIALSSFHEMIKAFEIKESQTIFKGLFDSIIKEDDITILTKVVPNLSEIVTIFQTVVEDTSGEDSCKNKDDSGKNKGRDKSKITSIKDWKDWNSGSTSDVDKSKESTKVWSKESLDQRSCLEDLINMGNYLNFQHVWRLEVTFIEQMNKCVDLFDLKEIADTYVDYLIKNVVKSVKEVRRCALESIILYIKKNHYINKTNEIMKKIVEELYNCKTFQGRLAFLEFYEQCSGHFSRQFFKNYNLNEMGLKLGEDKVTEIKKKFLENAVNLKKMVNEDRELGVKLDGVISKSVKDKNKYVSQLAAQTQKNLRLLTAASFEEFNKEDLERMQREEALKEKEKQEYDLIKRKQEEAFLKGRTDNFNALNNLLFGGRKGFKRATMNEIYTLKIIRNAQPATTTCLIETPKGKNVPPLGPLPTLKTHKTAPPAASPLQNKEGEIKQYSIQKPRMSKHLIAPIDPIPKKKAGSFSAQPNDKLGCIASLKCPGVERGSYKEQNTVAEPSLRQVPEMKSSKFVHLKELRKKDHKDEAKVPTIRKKNL